MLRELWEWVLWHRVLAALIAGVIVVGGAAGGYVLASSRGAHPASVARKSALTSPSASVALESPSPAAPSPSPESTPSSMPAPIESPTPTAPSITAIGAVPPGRGNAQSCFDIAHNELVLFGGYKDTIHVYDDTWLWRAGTWTEAHPATSAPGLQGGLMTYDPVAGGCVLFGGNTGTTNSHATWTWDGSTWTQAMSAQSPPNLGGVMAYDPLTSRLMLVTSVRSTSSDQPQTWTWNPAGWTQLQPVHEPSRAGYAGLAFDGTSDKMVLVTAGGTGSQVWVFNGGDWSMLATARPQVSSDFLIAPTVESPERLLLQSTDGSTWGFDGSQWTNVGSLNATGFNGLFLDVNGGRDLLVAGGQMGTNGFPTPTIWAWSANTGWNTV